MSSNEGGCCSFLAQSAYNSLKTVCGLLRNGYKLQVSEVLKQFCGFRVKDVYLKGMHSFKVTETDPQGKKAWPLTFHGFTMWWYSVFPKFKFITKV
jgi:hypothetical protein